MPPNLSSTALDWYQRVRPSRVAGSASLECIHLELESQADRTPQRAILVDENGYLTYAALRRAIESRAAALLQHCQGSRGGDAVGVLLENNTEKIVTYFACLKAGLAYVPLEPYPAPVMEQIFARAPFGVLVASRQFAPAFPVSPGKGTTTLWCEEEDLREEIHSNFPTPDPLRAAHLAFTSGTGAGIPRMVETDHAGSVLSHGWRGRLWPYDPAEDVVGCNIFGIWDAVPALCRNTPVVLIGDGAMRDPFTLASAITRFGITRIMMTPTLLDACLDCAEGIEALRRLRLLVLCGEAVTPVLMDRAWEVLPRVRIANLYSTAECHDIAAGEIRPGKAVTCGIVADFAEVHICDPDRHHRLVEVGSAGRVLVGGSALGRVPGHAPGASLEGFLEVELPAAAGGRRRTRVFDTGDLGRFHPGGELEILGRCDSGVKIRGSWVDPAAVERGGGAAPEGAAGVRHGREGTARPDGVGGLRHDPARRPGRGGPGCGVALIRRVSIARTEPARPFHFRRPISPPALGKNRSQEVAGIWTEVVRACGGRVAAGRSPRAGSVFLQGGPGRCDGGTAGRLPCKGRSLAECDQALRNFAPQDRTLRTGWRHLSPSYTIEPVAPSAETASPAPAAGLASA